MKLLNSVSSMLPRRRPASRGAMTLVEVMVVVTLTSIMMGVVISLFVSLLRWNQNLRDRSLQSEQLVQLAETMRTDIRQGSNVSIEAEGVLQIAMQGNQHARYELVPEGCRRILETPGSAVSRLDLFRIGPAIDWTVEREAGRRPLVMVSLERASADQDPGSEFAPLLVYGTLGADQVATADVETNDETEADF